mmetsp:Transcript_11173/g.16762  ORF Transcript_11173/g.16762 Transcript_11173/m.16762 type:complete len:245 (-) Transcript_11173:96-830(-)
MLGGEFTKSLQELLGGPDETRVSNNGLEDNSSNLVLVCLEDGLDTIEVVVFRTEGGGGGARGHSGGIGKAEGGNSRSSLNEEGVRVSVVASLKLDHLLAVGVSTAQTDHTHACLGTGVAETHHLDGGDGIDDHFSQLVLERAGGSEAGSLVHGLLDGIQYLVIGMSDDGGSPGTNVVDVLVVVHVPGVGSLDAVEHDGVSSDALECAHRGADTTRHQSLCLGEDLLALGECVSSRRSGSGHLEG